eukprot:1050771-Pelagomonas_calceolata.AAC.4
MSDAFCQGSCQRSMIHAYAHRHTHIAQCPVSGSVLLCLWPVSFPQCRRLKLQLRRVGLFSFALGQSHFPNVAVSSCTSSVSAPRVAQCWARSFCARCQSRSLVLQFLSVAISCCSSQCTYIQPHGKA